MRSPVCASARDAGDVPAQTEPFGPAMEDKKRILVVDDDPELRRALQRTLRFLAEAEVVVAASYREALQLFAAAPIDLVIADYSLGAGPSGLDLLSDIEESAPGTPRLLLTGHIDGPDLDRTGRSVGRMNKPWSIDGLLDACRDLLRS